MSKKYIAKSEDLENRLGDKLKGTIFKDVDTFIENYNLEIINKNSPSVKEIAEDILSTYKNVTQPKRGVLSVLSSREIMISDTIDKLKSWVMVTKLKRILSEKIDLGLITPDDYVAFSSEVKNPGIVRIEEHEDENGNEVKTGFIEEINEEKIPVDESTIAALTAIRGTDVPFTDEVDAHVLQVKEILEFDDEFIESIHDLIK